MRNPEDGTLSMGPDDLAETAFQVWRAVADRGHGRGYVGRRATLEDEGAGAQESWLRVGTLAEDLLGQMEGQTFDQAGLAVYSLYLDKAQRQQAPKIWHTLTELQRLAWQTVARHLTALLNSDEIGSIGEAEAFWVEWARERAARRNLKG